MVARLCVVLFLLVNYLASQGQTVTPKIGEIDGIVIDTTLKRVLPAATVSIYTSPDSKLVAYTLTDRNGFFSISNLPIRVPLRLTVSFLGYAVARRDFHLNDIICFNFGKLALQVEQNVIEEIEITAIPPVRMNGDTLEFNADAFQLEPNAVAEDLLKKLPGVVVWGDGMITVNGREIDALLVDGKPFFGGQSKIATQNIDKEAIKKVQVYKKSPVSNLLDSTMQVNLVLKNPNQTAYFGKVGLGAGPVNRHDVLGNINAFSSTYQFSAIAGSNNINKESDDITVLIKNSTFSNTEILNDYKSDFSKLGDIRSKKIGFFAERYFKPTVHNKQNNKIKVEYLRNIVETDLTNQVEALTSINADEEQSRLSTNQRLKDARGHVANVNYVKESGSLSWNGAAKFTSDHNTEESEWLDSVYDSGRNLLSNRNQFWNNEVKKQAFDAQISLAHRKNLDRSPFIPGDWQLGYFLKTVNQADSGRNFLNFRSLTDSRLNQTFNRSLDNETRRIEHRFSGRYGNLWNSIFRKESHSKKMDFVMDLTTANRNLSNKVWNVVEDGHLQFNDELSAVSEEHILDLRPGIALTYEKMRQLTGRFHQTSRFSADLRYQLYALENLSNRAFQNIAMRYERLLPEITYLRTTHKDGLYMQTWKATLHSTYSYPEVHNLVPIVDTAMIYNINLGNPNLRPSNSRELYLQFSHKTLRAKAAAYAMHVRISDERDAMGFYAAMDASGRSTFYMQNFNRSRFAEIGFNTARSFNVKTGQLQFKSDGIFTYSTVPSILVLLAQDALMNTSENVSIKLNADLYYRHQDQFDFNFRYNFIENRYSQLANSASITSHSNTFIFAASWKTHSKFTISADCAHNRISFSGNSDRFNILHVKLAKRFLRKDNFELSVSGHDLLNQNRNMRFSNTLNTMVKERQQALGRYFMLSLSYFPRRFRN